MTSFQKPMRPNRVRFLELPNSISKEALQNFAKDFGSVKKVDIKSDNGSFIGLVWFETPDMAEKAATDMNGKSINSYTVQSTLDQPPSSNQFRKAPKPRGGSAGRNANTGNFGNNNSYSNMGVNNMFGNYSMISGNQAGNYSFGGSGGGSGGGGRNSYKNMYFIRMLVPRQHVGLVIGHAGSTIKDITGKSHARLDVRQEFFNRPMNPLRVNSPLTLCQVIHIGGKEDECCAALREVYALLFKHADANKAEAPTANTDREQHEWLWLLAEDRHCGRLIGIAGKHFNTIREKTNAEVIVGNAPQLVYNNETGEPFFGGPERTVSIRSTPGATDPVGAISSASHQVLEKLLACRELDFKFAGNAAQPGVEHSMYAGILHGGHQQQLFNVQMARMMSTGRSGSELELDHCIQMRIPHSSAGAVIGHEGVVVRKIIQDSGAHVFVAKAEEEKNGEKKVEQNGGRNSSSPTNEEKTRLVTIEGTPETIARAQYLIFDRIEHMPQRTNQNAGSAAGGTGTVNAQGDRDQQRSGELRLNTLVKVPKSYLGRLVGKGGQTIREIQYNSGAQVKLPRLHPGQGQGKRGQNEKQQASSHSPTENSHSAEDGKPSGENQTHSKENTSGQNKQETETVEIIGNYLATQRCLEGIRNVLYSLIYPNSTGGGMSGGLNSGYGDMSAGGQVSSLAPSSLQALNLMGGGSHGGNSMGSGAAPLISPSAYGNTSYNAFGMTNLALALPSVGVNLGGTGQGAGLGAASGGSMGYMGNSMGGYAVGYPQSLASLGYDYGSVNVGPAPPRFQQSSRAQSAQVAMPASGSGAPGGGNARPVSGAQGAYGSKKGIKGK